jgi:retron-type reverse transcriptase
MQVKTLGIADLANTAKDNETKKGRWYQSGRRPFKSKGMKRIGNLYQKIISIDNLVLADEKAQKGKSAQYGVKIHNRNREANIRHLHMLLKTKQYRTSEYDVFQVYEPKERTVYRLPYFPDRIAHHAIMNILEPILVQMFTADTYSCIKGRGIHAAANKVKKALSSDQEKTKYCLKLDVTKFYPSIDHDILKQLLRKKFKDNDLLWLLDEIIDSAPGLPIGNYLSQYLANFYLTYFDHWIKEEMKVQYYFRYADDLVILGSSKPYLHFLLSYIKAYLKTELSLDLKGNYQIFPVESRGIDFVGYRFYHTHTLLRKAIKKNFAKMLSNNPNDASIASYMGWAKHCNSVNLLNKLLPNEKLL